MSTSNPRWDALTVGQRVVTDLPGYRVVGVLATIVPDPLCASRWRGALASIEAGDHDPMKDYPQLFAESGRVAPGVDLGWFHPAPTSPEGT